MPKDREMCKNLIQDAENRGFVALMLTVDAVVAGKRELDQRAKGNIGTAVRIQ
jgi:L-lactate dehydrogenase (cytochrome)